MAITLQIEGVQYSNFTQAHVELVLDQLCNTFEFHAVFPAGQSFPVRVNDACVVLVDDIVVTTGWIDSISGAYSEDRHIIIIKGRDKTEDIVDSSIGAIDDIRAGATLKQVFERVLKDIGSSLTVVDDVKPAAFTEEDLIALKPGENAFKAVEQYAAKRQCLLTSNADGNPVIAQSKSTQSSGYLQNAIGSDQNNIIEADWAYDVTNRFNTYIQKAQLGALALSLADVPAGDGLINQENKATDVEIRAGRQHVAVAKKSYGTGQLQKRAEWSKKIRKVRSLSYNCTVQGFKTDGGDLWAINTVVTVIDDFADLYAGMLINKVTFNYGENGSTTSLSLVEQNAYIIEISEPKPTSTLLGNFKL